MAFGRKVGRFATRAAQGALLAAPSANPYVIGGSALLSGAPALFEEDRKFDPKPFRRGFRKYAAARRSGARRTADEAGFTGGFNAGIERHGRLATCDRHCCWTA